MSAALARNRTLSLGSGRSSAGRNASLADFSLAQPNLTRDFDPCDATAAMFLYAQGSSVVVAHHDTLTIERRFSRHTEEVQLLAVDNISERGAGRLVISYDAGQTAIVWDLMTGDEVARFASYNNLSVAAWMRNGNVAFGNAQGNVILFEPSTSEHISARTIDQIPITALSPASDCRTYAIGYQNGSILICTLQPRFTIIHNLTTSRSPSPIVTLAWHASSSKQKSDMLATQTQDGDLRVWSIAKNHTSNEPAKVVRILKRTERFQSGPNWLGWSKNGRIVQYSEGETSSWDVRTKHVTYENVPTLEHVRGIAIYGPGATMFTLGPNNTAQQFDLNSPPVLVANVQHPANLLPPSPPVSIEEQKKGVVTMRADGLSSIPINVDIVSESDDDHMSPLARIAREMEHHQERQQVPDRAGALSPVSSQASFTTRSSAASGTRHKQASIRSQGLSDHTVMSLGSSLHSREPSVTSRDSFSISSVSSTQSGRSRPSARGSRLRQEVLRSPEEKVVVELFKFTRSRLSDLPYRAPQPPDGNPKSTNDLRRQMFRTIFGWEGEAGDLIRDELSRHPRGSPSSLLLTKWLGDIDTDIMATSSQSMTSSDWMLLALSGIGGQASQQKVARAYIQRLLEKGDVHTAATIMVGMGDQNDAIEIYVSHKRYMEALLLTSYVYPADWGRQAQLIRKWGEWAVQHSQQALAIRCFSCTGTESSEPYFSPPPQSTHFTQRISNIPDVLSPPLSPPGVVPRGPQRNMAKQAALKLVTSFGDSKTTKAKYFGHDDEKTPMNNIGVTPIAESALSPSGGDQSGFYRGQKSAANTPATAMLRTATPGGFTRGRLPSIGEMPTDVIPPIALKRGPASTSSVSEDSNSEYDYKEKKHSRKGSKPETVQLTAATFQPPGRAATASPMMQRTMNERAGNPLPPPSGDAFDRIKISSGRRNGSRDRKPTDLQLQWPPISDIESGDYMTTPELSATSSRHRTPTARSVAGSTSSYSQSSRRSPTASERSHRKQGLTTPVTGRSLDPYLSSLEAAQNTVKPKNRSRQASREATDGLSKRGRSSSRNPKAREPSEERGRSAVRYVKPAKRSPTSPIPMSPDELREFGYDDDRSETVSNSAFRRTKVRDTSAATVKLRSRQASRARQGSPEPLQIDTRVRVESKSRAISRKASPDPLNSRDERGRSKNQDGSGMRSPSSPLPMSPNVPFDKLNSNAENFGERKAFMADQENYKSRQRSASGHRGSSAVRHMSPKRREPSRNRNTQESIDTREESKRQPRTASQSRAATDLRAGDLAQFKLERQLKKESAARELEERRRSLTRRPLAPPITHPEELSPFNRSSSRSEQKSNSYSPAQLPVRSQTVSPESMRMNGENNASMQIGLPATPRAMQHPKFDPDGKDIPDVPQIPDGYNSASQVLMGSLDGIASSETLLPKTTFTPLPKTTYQAAPRHLPPPRSMSAPIPEEPLSPFALPATLPTHPAFHVALPPSNRRRNLEVQADDRSSQPVRKINPGESGPGTIGYEVRNTVAVYPSSPMVIGGIEETLAASSFSKDDLIPPPPPPPAPIILKELQHLATPPPPPPAPLYRQQGSPQTSAHSAVIEIVMDDDAPAPTQSTPPTRTTPPQEAPSHGAISHTRGRSQNDNSISGRLSRATERIRSASRGAPPQLSRTKSPPVSPPMGQAQYESVPTAKWVMDQMQNRAAYQAAAPAIERHPREVKADMEGGMI